MTRRPLKNLPSASALLCLAIAASASTRIRIDPQSTPKIEVLLYSFSGLSPAILKGTEDEATRLLRAIEIEPTWVDCTTRILSEHCRSPRPATDLIVRFTAKALPQVNTKALGVAGSSDAYATAFIFYDRVVQLRSQTRFLPTMLGRVMAHEIMHLLEPLEGHSELGLMRGQWTADDLRITSSASLGLPKRLHPRQAKGDVTATLRLQRPGS
jgi:hypothetical protein